MKRLLLPSFLIFLFGFFSLFGVNQVLAKQQALFFIISICIFFIFSKIGKQFFFNNARFFYFIFISLLLLTFIIGLEVKGSRRWIDLYFFNFQSSEFLKIFYILYLSKLLSRLSVEEFDIQKFLLLIAIAFLPIIIIFKQPDLGNALVYFFIFAVLLFFSGLQRQYVIGLTGLALFILPLMTLLLKDYQKNRILSFIFPDLEQQGNAYNMIQAVITVGSGKIFGRGIGQGTQSRLFFLPENNTDFAFSTLVEQFGLVGGFIVILLYMVLLYILLQRAFHFLHQTDKESKVQFLYVLGIFSYIFFQVFVNIGMNLGLLPIAGIALPFISSGGSLLATLFIGFALIP